MKKLIYASTLVLFVASAGLTKLLSADGVVLAAQAVRKNQEMGGSGQMGSELMQGMDMKGMPGHEQMMQGEKMPPRSSLQLAEGASVKIMSPKKGQIFKGDRVPVRFRLVKGKRGNHIHAYVDGALMGMFQSETGTLTGITPGHHTLEVRVVTADHKTELDATDRVNFVVK